MKIALSGYGKMGKAIELIAIERGHEISARISSDNAEIWQNLNKNNTDVVIDFSTPKSALKNIEKCLDLSLPVVVGTTGWYNDIETLKKQVIKNDQALLYASNFSIGVNIFFKINSFLASIMTEHGAYAASVDETHHTEKLDSPSGTAITLANDLINEHKSYNNWELAEKQIHENKLPITSHREPNVPGTHVISYESDIDLIQIRHEAKSRKGFANGAVLCAEWILGKKGFFNMSDVLNVNLR